MSTINVKITNRFLDSGLVSIMYQNALGVSATTDAQYLQGTQNGTTAQQQAFTFAIADADTTVRFAVLVYYGPAADSNSLYRNEAFGFSTTGTTEVNMTPLGNFTNGWGFGLAIAGLVLLIIAILVAIGISIYYSRRGYYDNVDATGYGSTTSFFVSGQ